VICRPFPHSHILHVSVSSAIVASLFCHVVLWVVPKRSIRWRTMAMRCLFEAQAWRYDACLASLVYHLLCIYWSSDLYHPSLCLLLALAASLLGIYLIDSIESQ
jgi:hypothetical protein